ncbi:acyltransferase family protein [Sphingobium sp.]|uniref:acyltransferase family protein n=1 Tax=Sphingobium sp. TaxID=1912891 RepID=UPI003BB73F6C
MSDQPLRAKTHLLGLEAGRFMAALLVCCYHFSLAFHNLRDGDILDMAFHGGHAGVDYFFVLSGFIIFHVHRLDLGIKDKLRPFLLKRFFRIYPLYWAIFAAMLTMFLIMPSLGRGREFDLFNLIPDAALLPTPGDIIVLQSWSLRHELIFYAIFGLAIMNRRIGVATFIAWQIGCLIIGLLHPNDLGPLIKPFFYIYNLGFGIGVATAWCVERWHVPRASWLGVVGLLGFIIAMWLEWKIGRHMEEGILPLGDIASPAIFMACSALIIFGVTQYERVGRLPIPDLLKLLGGCSYCLYLIHAPLGSVLIRISKVGALRHIPNLPIFVAMVAITVAASIAVHLMIEKPFLAYARKRWINRSNARMAMG